jgi:hypothetical protein
MTLETAQFVRAHIARSSFDQRMVNVWLTARVRPVSAGPFIDHSQTRTELPQYSEVMGLVD